MIIFNTVGCRIVISFNFLFLLCVLPLVLGYEVTIMLSLSCIIHELGHLIAIKLCNKIITGFKFTSCGINICCQKSVMSEFQVFIITFAGCLANLLAAMLLYNLNRSIACANIALGVYSILPNPYFDGYTILRLIFKKQKNLHNIGIAIYIIVMIASAIFLSINNTLMLLVMLYIMVLSLIEGD